MFYLIRLLFLMVFGLSQELFQLLCHFCLTFKNVKHDLQNHKIFYHIYQIFFKQKCNIRVLFIYNNALFLVCFQKIWTKISVFSVIWFSMCLSRAWLLHGSTDMTDGRSTSSNSKTRRSDGETFLDCGEKEKKETERQREIIHCIWMLVCVYKRERETDTERRKRIERLKSNKTKYLN